MTTNTITLGQVRLRFRGAYNGTTQYIQNDLVTFSTGVYISISPTLQMGLPPTDTTVWSLLFNSSAAEDFTLVAGRTFPRMLVIAAENITANTIVSLASATTVTSVSQTNRYFRPMGLTISTVTAGNTTFVARAGEFTLPVTGVTSSTALGTDIYYATGTGLTITSTNNFKVGQLIQIQTTNHNVYLDFTG